MTLPKHSPFLVHAVRFLAILLFASGITASLRAAQSTWVHFGSNGNLAYYTDAQGNKLPDFSYAGYEGGGVSLPVVPVEDTISPVAGDNTSNIQNALNTVGAMTLNGNGFRGAVLLNSGTYQIAGTLTMSKSGVVLRGSGTNGTAATVLLVTGSARTVINVGSGSTGQSGSTYTITDTYVPLGATTFHVNNASHFAVGNTIIIQRPWTQAWVYAVGMGAYWVAGSTAGLHFERQVTAISGTQLTIDVPLDNPIEQQWATGQVWVQTDTRISQVGIESLVGQGNITDYPVDILTGVFANYTNIKNAWTQNVVMQGWGNGLTFGGGTKWCTAQDCVYQLPGTGTADAAPAAYTISGQQCLMQRCNSSGPYYHIMVTQDSTAGPNVFLNFNCSGTHYNGGPHQRWAAGALHDNIVMAADTDPNYTPYLAINNRAADGSGQGWGAGFSIMYNCQVPQFQLECPALPFHYNWTIGGIGSKQSYSDPGTYDAEGAILTPQSLYMRQLKERLGASALGNIGYSLFALSGTAPVQTILSGSSVTATVNVTPVNGFTGPVALSVSGLPAGATGTLNPTSITTSGSSTLTIVTSGTGPIGTFPIVVTGTGAGSSGPWTDTYSFNLTINPTGPALGSIVLSPSSASLTSNHTQQFTAAGLDTGGNPMQVPLNLTWSILGAGSVSGSGLYTADYLSSSGTVVATCGSISGSAGVTVTNAPPLVAVSASATLTTSTTVKLTITGTDPDGNDTSGLTYTWAATSLPAGATTPAYSNDGNNASKSITATVNQAGTYTFVVTITDLGWLTTSSTTSINVPQSPASIVLAPVNPTVSLGGTQQITATCTDQFGDPITTSTLNWAATAGSIAPLTATTALYTAPSSTGGTATVTASLSGVTGTDTINIVSSTTDGIWINPAGGSWTTATNWQTNGIPSGSGFTADFSTLTLSATATVTLDQTQVIGNLIFGDTAPYSWILNTGSAGTLALTGSGPAPTIKVKNQSATINAVLTGTQGFITSGSGTLVLTNSNTYTGATIINPGATLMVGTGGNTIAQLGSASISGSASPVTDNGTLAFDYSANPSSYLDDISGTGAIVFNTPPAAVTYSMKLDGSNAGFTGTATIGKAVRLQVSSDVTGYSAYDEFTGASLITVAAGGQYFIDNTVNAAVFAGNWLLSGTEWSADGGSPEGTLRISTTTTMLGSVTLGSTVLLNIKSGMITTIDGAISDSGSGYALIETGGGSLNLANSGNNWNGGTFVDQGTLQLEATNALPPSGTVTLGYGGASAGSLSGGSPGILDLNGHNQTVGGLAIGTSGTTVNEIGNSSTTSNSTLTFAGGSSVIGGVIVNTLGGGNQTVALTVSSGTLQLNGSDTYTGPTTVNGGMLNLAGSIAGSAVTVNGGTLAGTRTTGAVTVANGGTLAPGTSGTGGLNLSNTALSLSGSTLMEVNASTGACTSVQNVSSVTYGGILSVTNLSGTFAAGDTFTLFSSGAYNSVFSSILLPTLPGSIEWNTSNLAVNGSISIQTPFSQWQSQYFTQAQLNNPAISGPTADPAGDGIPNLLKYALGLNPTVNSVAGLPLLSNSGGFLKLQFQRNLSATDVTYSVIASDDLVAWTTIATRPAGASSWQLSGASVTDTSGAVTVMDGTAISSQHHRFLELMISDP